MISSAAKSRRRTCGILDAYHEIGLALSGGDDPAAVELLTDEAYLALYRDRLAERDAVAPLGPDGRLWRGREARRAASAWSEGSGA